MPLFLRQATASQEIPLGFFVDSTDGNTEETGLTIANTDIKIWKTGATTLADKNSGGATHIANGLYYTVLDATDTDTIGPLVVYCHPAGALATRTEATVLDEAVYDVLFGTTALATISNITGGTITTATNVTTVNGLAANVITATAIQADAITAAKMAADVSAEIADAVWEEAQADHVAAGSFGVTASEIADILVDTAEIGAAGAGLTVLATQASVNTIDDFLDTEVAAIKAKTDSLTFTVAGQVDANIQSVNDVTVTGTGAVGNEWGP